MFKCPCCQAKDKQIEYLQRLIDQVLIQKGMSPILPPQGGDKASEELEKLTVASDIDPTEVIKQYGGDS